MHDIDSQDIFFMRRAIDLAHDAKNANEVPVGAVVVIGDQDKKIIGEGFNCKVAKSDPTAHAEIVALRQASQSLNQYHLLDATVYTTIEPCVMCVGAMLNARIKRLVFGGLFEDMGGVKSIFRLLDNKKLTHRIQYQGGVLAIECGKLLNDFFEAQKKFRS